MLRIDHLAVVADRLDEGVALVERLFGVTMAGGGKHPLMGTHNRLLSLGDLYLEVIAVDPESPAPGRPRWFDMDRFAGPPRLTNWVAGCDDLVDEIELGPPGIGQAVAPCPTRACALRGWKSVTPKLLRCMRPWPGGWMIPASRLSMPPRSPFAPQSTRRRDRASYADPSCDR
jgi:hypothetical protein